MKIVFTKHAKRKFKFHRELGWKFLVSDIKSVIQEPYFSEFDEEREVKIALKSWDKNHDLRVIYEEKDDIITVITFYPTEKGRYTK